MSQENVEVVRRMYDAFHAGDVDGALSHFDPDVLVDASKARPDMGVGKGREQVNAAVTSWLASWEEWHEEIEEMRDLGSRVLVLSVQRGRGKGSGVEWRPATRCSMTFTVARSSAWRMYGTPAEALAAVGLSY